jgi:hypothetical protein
MHSAPSESANLFEQLANEISPTRNRADAAKLRPFGRPNRRFDLAVVLPRNGSSEDGDVLARLERSQMVSAVRRGRGGGAHVRLSNRFLFQHFSQVTAARPEGDIASGRNFAIHFCDPNPTKALHIGHLRNLALGNALTSALTIAGGEVRSIGVVGDFGRNMAEALAATIRDGGELGARPDQRIGRLYANFVSSRGESVSGVAPADVPLARELAEDRDEADDLLHGMFRGEPEVTQPWRETCDAVVSAQVQTLRRLGVRLDAVDYDSRFVSTATALARRSLRNHLFTFAADGSIAYQPTSADRSPITVVRRDGIPTQYMLSLAYWTELLQSTSSAVTGIRVLGEEWREAAHCSEQLLPHLSAIRSLPHPPVFVFHGMVTVNGKLAKSSRGNPPLIDDLLDFLGASSRLETLPISGGAEAWPHGLGANLALGYFLSKPPLQQLDVTAADFLPNPDNVACIASCALSVPGAGDPDPSADDPDFRFAVVRAAAFRQQLIYVASTLNVHPLASYLSHFANWYLETARSDAVALVVHTVLRKGLRALGLQAPFRQEAQPRS